MDRISIKSSTSDAELSFHNRVSDDFIVEFNSIALRVVQPVCAYTDPLGIPRLFQDLASHSKPWTEARTWRSLEGEFAISAMCDVVGHVWLRLSFNNCFGGWEEWQADATLRLELGQLPEIARVVTCFFGSTLAS